MWYDVWLHPYTASRLTTTTTANSTTTTKDGRLDYWISCITATDPLLPHSPLALVQHLSLCCCPPGCLISFCSIICHPVLSCFCLLPSLLSHPRTLSWIHPNVITGVFKRNSAESSVKHMCWYLIITCSQLYQTLNSGFLEPMLTLILGNKKYIHILASNLKNTLNTNKSKNSKHRKKMCLFKKIWAHIERYAW